MKHNVIMYLEVFLLAALAAASVWFFKPTVDRLNAELTTIRNSVMATAESLLNRRISYSSMKTTIFNLIDIRDVRLTDTGIGTPSGDQGDAANSETDILSVRRVRVSWSLGAIIAFLARNEKAALPQAVHEVILDDPVINFDAEKDADILNLFRSAEGTAGQGEKGAILKNILGANTVLRIRGGAVQVSAGDKALLADINALNLEAATRSGRFVFSGELETNAHADLARLSEQAALTDALSRILTRFVDPLSASAALKIEGSCALDFSSAEALVTLNSLTSDLFDTRRLRFSARLEGNRAAIATADERLPFDARFEANLATGALSGALWADNFSPQKIVALKGNLSPYAAWLGVTASGTASFALDPDGVLSYEAFLNGRTPSSFPAGRVSFVLDAEGDMSEARVRRVSLTTGYGTFGFGGRIGLSPLSPQGTLSVSNFSLSGNKQANARLFISTRGRDVRLSGGFVDIGDVSLESPEIKVSLGDDMVSWSLSVAALKNKAVVYTVDTDAASGTGASAAMMPSVLSAGVGIVKSLPESPTANTETPLAHLLPHQTITAEGAFDYDPRNFEASLTLNDAAAGDIVAMAAPFAALPALSEDMRNTLQEVKISTEVFANTDFKRFLYNAPFIEVNYRELQASASIAGTDSRAELYGGLVNWGSGEIGAALFADFADTNNINFGLNLSYKDVGYDFRGVVVDKNTIDVQGSYGTRARISLINRSVSGFIMADAVPIPIAENAAYVGLNTSFRFDSLQSWNADIVDMSVSNLITPASRFATLRLAGTADQDRADFQTISFDDGMALNGNATLLWEHDFSQEMPVPFSFVSGVVALQDAAADERYYLELSYSRIPDNWIGVWLTGKEMRLAHFLNPDYDAVLSGSANAQWTSINDFSAEVVVDLLSARVSDTELFASGRASASDSEIRVSGVQARYGAITGTIDSFNADLDSLSMPSMRLVGNFNERILELDCGLDAAYASIASWLDAPRAVEAISGVLAVRTARIDSLQAEEPFEFDFFREGGTVSLYGGPRDMLRFQISDGGMFFADIAAPSPVRGTIIGTLGGGNIDASTRDLYVDLTALWRLIPPQKVIGITGGFATASLDIRGPLSAPEFFGTANAESLALSIPLYLQEDIRPVPAVVTLTGSEMTFGPIPAAVGRGAGIASGWFRFDRWIPRTFTIDITVPSKTPVPYAFDLMGIVAKGGAVGDLHLGLEDNVMTVRGDLTAENTEVTLNLEELENGGGFANSMGDTQLSFITDIQIRAGRKLDFLWPTADFPIVQATAGLDAFLKIESDSSTGRLLLQGDVPLRSGQVFYSQRNFYLKEGVLSFNENESHMDPRLSARAETRDHTSDGPVTISLVIDNSPLSAFTVRLESNPALSQVEIFSLLGQNMTGEQTGGSNNSFRNSVLSLGSDLLSQTVFMRRAQRSVRDLLRLDMFSFRTQFLHNMIMQIPMFQEQGATQSEMDGAGGNNGLDEQRRNSTFGNFFDNTTVYLGKYINPNVFAQGMLTMRADNRNVNGVSFDLDLGLEFSSPLFAIRFNFAPTLDQSALNPRSLFVDDMSFTLTWRKSF